MIVNSNEKSALEKLCLDATGHDPEGIYKDIRQELVNNRLEKIIPYPKKEQDLVRFLAAYINNLDANRRLETQNFLSSCSEKFQSEAANLKHDSEKMMAVSVSMGTLVMGLATSLLIASFSWSWLVLLISGVYILGSGVTGSHLTFKAQVAELRYARFCEAILYRTL
jgi:hypothetical protein